MKRLIDWARQQKRRGKLKQAFRVYDFWRRKSREVRVWWWRNAPLAFYRLVVAVRPNWEDGHYALGKALQGRYIFLAGLKSGEAKRTAKVSWSEITDIGERAVAHVRKALSLDPDRLDMYEYLFGLLYFLGKTEEASIVLQQFEDLKSNLAEAGQENSLGFRFVPTGLATAIGRYTHLEYYVRASLLGWKPPHKIIMLLPDEASVSNPCFLDYWRRYITVISDSKTIEALSPLVEQLSDPMMSMTFNGQALFNSAALTMVQERWDAEKRPPLLTLSASDHERGWRCLTGLGVPEGAWFVCLHVREPGFRDGDSRDGSFRNADIDTYLPAIKNGL